MDATQPYPLAPPQRVDPAAIERGLERFWSSAEQAPLLGGAGSVVRSCTLNFAVVLSPDDEPSRITDIVAPVTLRHPCRIFVLATRPDAAEALDVSVSALCHLPAPGQPHICCEQITVTAAGRAVDGVPHLLLALLVPDLPLVVWWRGRPPLGTPRWSALNAIADRVVIDTLELGAGAAELAQVAELLEGEPAPALADLAWSRLTPWRTLTAQCFDAPEQRRWLQALDHVRVRVSGRAVTSPALLWLGWLASRLGWTFEAGSGHGSHLRYTSTAGPAITAEIESASAGETGALCAIELAAGGAAAVRYTVAACAEHAVRATVAAGAAPPAERVVPLVRRDVAALLSDEFDLAGRDPVYEAALREAGRLVPSLRRA